MSLTGNNSVMEDFNMIRKKSQGVKMSKTKTQIVEELKAEKELNIRLTEEIRRLNEKLKNADSNFRAIKEIADCQSKIIVDLELKLKQADNFKMNHCFDSANYEINLVEKDEEKKMLEYCFDKVMKWVVEYHKENKGGNNE